MTSRSRGGWSPLPSTGYPGQTMFAHLPQQPMVCSHTRPFPSLSANKPLSHSYTFLKKIHNQ